MIAQQITNLLREQIVHPERRMQTIQPEVLVNADPASSVVCVPVGRSILIWNKIS